MTVAFGDGADRVLEFPEFIEYLSEQLEIDSLLEAETRLVEDLDFDSVRMLELSIVIEDLGVELDDADLENLASVQLAYDAYEKQARASSGRPTESC